MKKRKTKQEKRNSQLATLRAKAKNQRIIDAGGHRMNGLMLSAQAVRNMNSIIDNADAIGIKPTMKAAIEYALHEADIF